MRRVLLILLVLALPAAAFRVACIDKACDEEAVPPKVQVPFCSLPAEVRSLVVQGYRNERSPEVLAVTKTPSVSGQVPDQPTGAAPVWPSLASPPDSLVPIVIAGPGIPRVGESDMDTRLGLEDVSPTIATAIGLDWQFATYRSGTPVPGTHRASSPLVVLIGWKGVGADAFDAARPHGLLQLSKQGASSFHGTTGSLPVDSTASLTTVGSGAPPRVHGITGTLLRNDSHQLVEAWSPRAPYAVINGLGDALDRVSEGEARVGLVATAPYDRGVIGGTWYEGIDTTWSNDDDIRIVKPGKIAASAATLLATGYGADHTTDLLGVTLEGPVRGMDAATTRIIAAAQEASGGQAVVAVFGTGEAPRLADPPLTGADVQDTANQKAGGPVVEAAVPGGLFLSRDAMAENSITSGEVVAASKTLRTGGQPAMADVFPAFAITLERFC